MTSPAPSTRMTTITVPYGMLASLVYWHVNVDEPQWSIDNLDESHYEDLAKWIADTYGDEGPALLPESITAPQPPPVDPNVPVLDPVKLAAATDAMFAVLPPELQEAFNKVYPR